MNEIIFNKGRGGLGRELAGADHISGLVAEMTAANIPAALVALGNYATLFSVQDAADLGIVYTADNSNLELDSLRYSIESIYGANTGAIVHLAIADLSATTPVQTASTELITLQNKADGAVKQALLLAVGKDFATGDLTTIQASCDALEAEHKPLSVVYEPNFIGITMTSTDLRALTNKNVSVVSGMDGNGVGRALFVKHGSTNTIGCGGALLGAISAAKVHENVAWVRRFNMNANLTNEFDEIVLGDGRIVREVSTTELNTIDSNGYIFLKKHIGIAGSYFNDTHTATSVTSDYAFIENNRTIDKSIRGARTFLLPSLNSPLYVNADGTLAEDTIASFKNDTDRALEEMERAEEISNFKTIINPAQNVLQTSTLTITLNIIPVGVARNIVVNVGFAVQLS